jgi:predicted DNA-binding transcriptional regulator YafY
MRADRLLTILLLLQNEGKLTARELARRLEVSERTILRDMEALSMAGVPVYAERGNRGGWRLSDGYRTDLSGMKTEELASLLLSASPNLLRDLGIERHFRSALQKLLASSSDAVRRSAGNIRSKILIDGAGWHDIDGSGPNLPTIQEAVFAERRLHIRYGREGALFERTVNPLGLAAKRSVWYLVAEADGAIRTYRTSRIESAVLTGETFAVPEGFDLAAYWEQSAAEFKRNLPRFPAHIRVKAAIMDRLKHDRFVQVLQTEPAEEDWVAVQVEFATLEHGCWTMLSFGAAGIVLAPAELRDAVRSSMLEMAEVYGLRIEP